MNAPCGRCGGSVMPYRRYLFHLTPTSTCASCGGRVRLRHYGPIVGSVLVALAILAWSAFKWPESLGWVAAAFAVIALAVDYWTWRALPWDPVPKGAAATDVAPPGASA